MTDNLPEMTDIFGLAQASKAAASVCNTIIKLTAHGLGIAYGDMMTTIRARRQAGGIRLLAQTETETEVDQRRALAAIEREIDLASVLQAEKLEDRAKRRLMRDAMRHQDKLEAITVAAIEH